MTDYYDLVLGLIPLALFGLGGGLYFAGVELTMAIMFGGLVAVGLVGHALFINSPVASHGVSSTDRREVTPR